MPTIYSLPDNVKYPPIVEVVCGFVFEPLVIDSLDFGIYWDKRSETFPKKALHPALQEFIGIQLGTPSMRAWFVSEDEQWLLQMQSDRFYVNWRRVNESYPRFLDQGTNKGIKSFALEEYDTFSLFCKEHIGQLPSLTKLELSKIDMLVQGKHYKDAEDLGNLLKVARVFEDIQAGSASRLDLRLVEQHQSSSVHVAVAVAEHNTRIETRTVFASTEDLSAAFEQANKRLNEVFIGLLNPAELVRLRETSVEE